MVFKNNDETHISERGDLMELETTFMIVGFIVIICIMLIMIPIIVCDIKDLIVKTYRACKRKSEIKHRFDKPPVAKCYCIDCKYGAYFGNISEMDDKHGKCILWNGDVPIRDDNFCYRADPKK